MNLRNKGITLIALIITIIVLLILVGITIGIVSSDNSVINQTLQARQETKLKEEEEKINLAVYDAASLNTENEELSEENVKKRIRALFFKC